MRALRGERGLAPVMLVVIVVWALAAVLMLTGTLLAAQRIDDRVGTIVGSTSGIDEDLDAVRLAAETGRISSRILEAVTPLTGQLDQVVTTGESIDRTAGSILSTARSIEREAVSIEARASSIDATARSIRSTAGGIAAVVESIEGTADAIEGTAASIRGNAGSITASVQAVDRSVERIERRFGAILDEGRGIDSGVAGINIRAGRVIDVVRPVEQDLEDVLEEVGLPGREMGHRQRDGDKSLHGHANAIDCQLGGDYCGDR